jgi:hypothetical protein
MERRTNPTDLRALLDTPPWEWPRDAGETFHRILTDSNASGPDRLIAARLGGDLTVVNDELSDALLGIVSGADQPDELRATAAISLGPVLEHRDTCEFDDPLDLDKPPIAEHTFHRIQLTLQKLYLDESVPRLVRRRILEASVRAPRDWHRDAITRAYSSGDRDWMLTAVFAMRWVRGMDDLILRALESGDPEIHCEAVHASGNWELKAARDHVVALVFGSATPKPLRLAAIGAVGCIVPEEAAEILSRLTGSRDPEIAEAADEAILMAITGDSWDEDDEAEDISDWIH